MLFNTVVVEQIKIEGHNKRVTRSPVSKIIDLQKEENMYFRDEIVCLFTDLVYLDCMFEGFPEFITLMQLSQKRSPPII